MNQKSVSNGHFQKSPVCNSFALMSFNSLLTIKDQTFHNWNISLNPIRGKGPPGDDHSPGRSILFLHYSLFKPISLHL